MNNLLIAALGRDTPDVTVTGVYDAVTALSMWSEYDFANGTSVVVSGNVV